MYEKIHLEEEEQKNTCKKLKVFFPKLLFVLCRSLVHTNYEQDFILPLLNPWSCIFGKLLLKIQTRL